MRDSTLLQANNSREPLLPIGLREPRKRAVDFSRGTRQHGNPAGRKLGREIL